MNRTTLVAAAGLGLAAAGVAVAEVALRRPPEEDYDISGAPFGLLGPRGRAVQVSDHAHVVGPRWEPAVLTALAKWEPARPQGALARAAACSWAAPLTLPGAGIGFAGGVRPYVHDGGLVFATVRGLPAALLEWRGIAAMAIGQVVVTRKEPSASLLAHELVHVRQAERLGPLLAPLYLVLLALYGYARHPLERAARRAGRRARGQSVGGAPRVGASVPETTGSREAPEGGGRQG